MEQGRSLGQSASQNSCASWYADGNSDSSNSLCRNFGSGAMSHKQKSLTPAVAIKLVLQISRQGGAPHRYPKIRMVVTCRSQNRSISFFALHHRVFNESLLSILRFITSSESSDVVLSHADKAFGLFSARICKNHQSKSMKLAMRQYLRLRVTRCCRHRVARPPLCRRRAAFVVELMQSFAAN